jgi:ribosomal protein L31E
MLLARNGERSRLKKGVLDSVARDGNCSRRSVQRIWKETKTGGGVNAIKNNLKQKTGRKKIRLDREEENKVGQRGIRSHPSR